MIYRLHVRLMFQVDKLNEKDTPMTPEYSLEGLMLKLKLQYFAHLMRRADSLEKTLKLGNIKARGEGNGRG